MFVYFYTQLIYITKENKKKQIPHGFTEDCLSNRLTKTSLQSVFNNLCQLFETKITNLLILAYVISFQREVNLLIFFFFFCSLRALQYTFPKKYWITVAGNESCISVYVTLEVTDPSLTNQKSTDKSYITAIFFSIQSSFFFIIFYHVSKRVYRLLFFQHFFNRALAFADYFAVFVFSVENKR